MIFNRTTKKADSKLKRNGLFRRIVYISSNILCQFECLKMQNLNHCLLYRNVRFVNISNNFESDPQHFDGVNTRFLIKVWNGIDVL